MKFRHLVLLTLLSMAAITCKTEEKRLTPKPAPMATPVTVVTMQQPALSFSQDRYGAADLDNQPDTFAALLHGAPLTTYEYTITSSKGMEARKDTAIKGRFTTDSTGAYTWNKVSLQKYRDGEITLTIVNTRQRMDSMIARSRKERYVVRNYLDFLAMARSPRMYGRKASYTQACDFAFPDTVFKACPIPVKFAATYNGKGHTISNLAIAAPYRRKGATDVALFDTLAANAVIKNVRLVLSPKGIRNANANAYTAGLATMHYGTILNCSVKGSIRFAAGSGLAGGLVAEAQHARIVASSFTGKLEGNRVAGIVGNMQYTDVNMCYANFAAKSNGAIAGILGFTYLGDSTQATTVSNCFVHFTKLEGEAASKAGAIAIDDFQNRAALTVSNCYSNGPVPTDGSTTYASLDELNLAIGNVSATGDMHTPPHNRPFKPNRNTNKPPLLWWQ